MNEMSPLPEHAQTALPDRDAISAAYFQDEDALVADLCERARLGEDEQRRLAVVARDLVHAAREGRTKYGHIDAFLHQYGLTTEEGIILMCLAEALLRIPDARTADALIDDKISSGNWQRHLGKSDNAFVNASSWGLMLTGQVMRFDTPELEQGGAGSGLLGLVKRMTKRTGEPIIRQAMRHAMKIMGDQFVLGRTISEAQDRAEHDEERGYRFSYDMLGEAARTMDDAERYYQRYMDAIRSVGARAGEMGEQTRDALMGRPGLSVKLSAIHPRFEPMQAARIRDELVPNLIALVKEARAHDLAINIDAEEQDRLDLTLQVFGDVLMSDAVEGWDGFGIVVQAYGRRALPALRWLRTLSQKREQRIPVRLVKGAYWDTEVKLAQELGLESYPVFTRKTNTDVSYLACARMMLAEPDIFYPQFATHNAHTISAIHTMAGNAPFEFQRLHGMGEAVYEEVVGAGKLDRPVRVYAPVGSHDDLLAYLVRRLLENGANSSFVNRLADDALPVEEIIADPVERARANTPKHHPDIPAPRDLFQPTRKNAEGFAIWDASRRAALLRDVRDEMETELAAGPIVRGVSRTQGDNLRELSLPHDCRKVLGTIAEASLEEVDAAVATAAAAWVAWDGQGGAARAACLERAADLYEESTAMLIGLIMREGGKTLANAQADLREAVDFLRYYAVQARAQFEQPRVMPGPTGETNTLSLHGRGVFACISPWNFPVAIFTGQIAGALAAGNAVVAKPAEQTPLTAFAATHLLLKAGVPEDVLHLVPGDGAKVGAALTKDARVAGVAFTGSNETARQIQRTLAAREGAMPRLIAETGGMNAMIVDSSALAEQVIRDAVISGFDSAGQRCSALRVLYLQDDVAEPMITMLKGAMHELKLGDPMLAETDIGPVIDTTAEDMLVAHKMRMKKEGRELLDLPVPADCRKGTFVAPALYEIDSIGQLEHEVFGPIVHVVRYAAADLERVCDDINDTGYGLTLGIHTRIQSTVDRIVSRMRVGNIYVNRNQIGAVVGVQPFGGEGLSGTGPKAGGPHYLHAFATERVVTTDITATGGNTELLSLGSVRVE
ncbi:MAG: bifunctional proline dehydrogenase/L-glutamate gamma-semialdehyde dehydrogenase PutA [Pseudomonadota bacterium]